MKAFSVMNGKDNVELIDDIYLSEGVILSNQDKIEDMKFENSELKMNIEFNVLSDSSLKNDKQRKLELERLLKKDDKYTNNDKKIKEYQKQNKEKKVEGDCMRRLLLNRNVNIVM